MGEFFKWLIRLLKNQIGEVNLEDGEGELETPEVEDTPGEVDEIDESQDAADTDEALKEPDEEEEPPQAVPYSRFKEVNEKAKAGETAQTKLEQFKKLGPEGYYSLYPDEKPEEAEPEPEKTPAAGIPSMSEMAGYVVQGGDYAGMTLGEVAKEDPLYAVDLYNQHRQSIEQQHRQQEQTQADNEREVTNFMDARSSEVFGKKAGELTREESAQVEAVTDAVIKWMTDTGRGFGNMEDAYYLMHKDEFFQKTQEKALKTVVAALKSPVTPSIRSVRTGTDASTISPNMSPAELKAKFDQMTDKEEAEFLKNAPRALKDKYPQIPWD